jgi:hypothetical protein
LGGLLKVEAGVAGEQDDAVAHDTKQVIVAVAGEIGEQGGEDQTGVVGADG